MPKVEINDFEMYYDRRGEGEPLLLLHGGMGIGDAAIFLRRTRQAIRSSFPICEGMDGRPARLRSSRSKLARKTFAGC